MNAPSLLWLAQFAVTVTCCSLAGSCTTTRQDLLSAAVDRPGHAETPRLAQVGTGRQAHFVTCQPLACPKPSAKTIATEAGDARSVPALGSTVDGAPLHMPARTAIGAALSQPTPTAPEHNASTAEVMTTELTVHFASASSRLTAFGRSSIDEAVQRSGITRIGLSGRTDSVGPASLNHALAQARALAVDRYLRQTHPSLAPLIAAPEAAGSCCYVASNETLAGRARNRRVEIEIMRTSDDP